LSPPDIPSVESSIVPIDQIPLEPVVSFLQLTTLVQSPLLLYWSRL